MNSLRNAFRCILGLASLISACQAIPKAAPANSTGSPESKIAPSAKAPRVSATVQLYVMSQCPYGVKAEDSLIGVLENFGDEVELRLDYIGTIEKDGSLHSMHGAAEVAGDTDQVCAARVAPERFLRFLSCVNQDWKQIPSNTYGCALKTGIDPAALNECRSSGLGAALLAQSFRRSEAADVMGSPTIKINGTDYEGSRGAAALASVVCGTIPGESKPKLCQDLPKPAEVRVIAITDRRCKDCAVEPTINSLRQVFPGLQVRVLDWEDPQAKIVLGQSQRKRLPLVLFDESLDLDVEGATQLSKWIDRAGSYRSLRIPAEFDPTAEICDNQIDDTNDGKVDCADSACKEVLPCRVETKGTLDIFVMSQCPFAVRGLRSMKEVLDAFGKKLTFHVHFIAEIRDGEITSTHGKEEVDEDLRQICVIKHYGQNNRFMDYLWCRNEDIQNSAWKKCATGGIDPRIIESCSTGSEGRRLLEADLKIAQALKIGASPTWIANNKSLFKGLTAASIQKAFCDRNPGLTGCDKLLSATEPTQAAAAPEGEGCEK